MFDLGLMKLLSLRMDWAAKRLEMVSQNVAHSDTPGYKPKDLPPFDQLIGKEIAKPAMTHAKHLTPVAAVSWDPIVQEPQEVSPNGNGVVLEEQMVKVDESRGAYNTSVSLMEKYMKMMRVTIGSKT